MARGACTFRQRDLECALKAVHKAGKEAVRIDVTKDGFTIILRNGDIVEKNEWDEDAEGSAQIRQG